MIDFISPSNFYTIYINICLFVVLFTLLHNYVLDVSDNANLIYINVIGYVFLAFIFVFIGFRPVSHLFGDMQIYARHFDHMARGDEFKIVKDALFYSFMKLSSLIMTKSLFFFLCCFLYVHPMYVISKKFFGVYWFYSFLMLVVSFQFWPYAVNGIRNGIGTSFFLWGVAYYEKKILMIFLVVLSNFFHQTLLLPIAAFIATFFYNEPKVYIKIWLLAIPMSLILGGFWEYLFASLGFGDDRLSGYLTGADGSGSAKTGFRFDFLIYSAAPVVVGAYFILKKEFKDKIYAHIYNTYLLTNAFWILVIRASFSNRFAYLSWFMMGLIIIYPFIKTRYFDNQSVIIGKTVFFYFAFTYFMFYVYYA